MTVLALLLMLNLGAVQAMEVGPGEILNVVSAGAGDPVVLLPGLSGCAYGYRNIVEPLSSDGYRTVIIEPLGMGASSRPKDADYTLTAQAVRVAAVMDSLGLRGAVVVGHGVSASVALRLAYRRPELVVAVISVEGGPSESAATPTMERSLKFASMVAKLGGGRLLREKFKASLEEASGDRSWIDRRTLGRYLKNIDNDLGDFIAGLQAMARSQETESLQKNLPRIFCPVLLMAGQAPHSGSLDDEEIDILSQGLTDFEVQQVPGSGHFIFEEQPDVVVSAIRSMNKVEGEMSCVQ